MKFQKFLMLAGVAALMASCSQDEPLSVPQDAVSAEIAANDSYVLIGFEMPSQTGRAAEPADEDDSDPAEYKVLNGSLLLFKNAATGEGDATFVRRLAIGSSWEAETEHKDISRQTKVALQIPAGTLEAGATYSGVIVLNAPSGYKWPTAPVTGENPQPGQKFSDWATTAQNITFTTKVGSSTYMTMVSAPKYTGTTSSSSTATLVNIPQNKIVKSLDELDSSKPAATFYVNRVAAKISVVSSEDDKTFTLTGDDAGKIVLDGWDVDIVAKNAFPIQNVNGLDLSKPYMNTKAASSFSGFARCSWAKSPNYSTELKEEADRKAAFTYIADVTEGSWPACKYVKENTMDYAYQIQNRTTRVVIRANFIKNGNEKAATIFKFGKLGTALDETEFLAAVKTKADIIIAGDATVSLKDDLSSGNKAIADVVEVKKGATEFTTQEYAQLAVQLGLSSGTAEDIAVYIGGVCYYTVLLRHFLSTDGKPEEGTAVAAAPDFQKGEAYTIDHLGRYGILRNNWYEITVNSVGKIGEPVIPTPTDDPDDKDDGLQAINFDIFMLNWAKHSQTANL
ncbi:MAG: fimbria major subunit [Muribaculaceae bacterium]|nr:fimbria major subunit [Muribaculaceae bacterium]